MATFTENWTGVADGSDINGNLTWTKLTHNGDVANITIASEQLRFASTAEHVYFAEAQHNLNTDMRVTAVLRTPDTGTNPMGVVVRSGVVAGSTFCGYMGTVSTRNQQISLWKFGSGGNVLTQLSFRAETIAANTDYTITLTAVGDLLTLEVDGFDPLTHTDSDFATQTKWGIYGRTRTAPRVILADNVVATDELGGGPATVERTGSVAGVAELVGAGAVVGAPLERTGTVTGAGVLSAVGAVGVEVLAAGRYYSVDGGVTWVPYLLVAD